jgi:DTW domain-containing protein YfiP
MVGMTDIGLRSDAEAEAEAECERCGKILPLCVCEGVTPLKNRTRLLILQHPQEQDRALGTARLTTAHLANAVLKIGLSWPSLSRALGETVDPQRWGVLYLGSVRAADLDPEREIIAVDRRGEAEASQTAVLRSLEGIVLLDGTWSQAKALWWRNPWMLRCQRIVLNPAEPSRYGKLRKEPRRDGLSTLESAAFVLSRLDRAPDIETQLLAGFDRLLERYRALRQESPEFDQAETRRIKRPPGKGRSGKGKRGASQRKRTAAGRKTRAADDKRDGGQKGE